DTLEPHDSFYIGSDVFYTYMVQNGWWKLLMKQKTKEGYFKAAAVLRQKLLKGKFPDELKEQFQQMLEYFGQSPIIVRSSSLLEDAFGNAFAGKYDSFFCVNQGTPEQRYHLFEEAVRKVFSSTMNEDALTYRWHRGLDQHDEQMALLVQRVSGAYQKQYFFPYLAGVGFGYNAFVWHKDMNPEAGMLRLVFGLGTRAVNRVEHDYPRIIALDKPLLRPNKDLEDTRKYSQREVDVLNVEKNILETISINKLLGEQLALDMRLVAVRDRETAQKMKEIGLKDRDAWLLTFDKLLSETDFAQQMREIMDTVEKVYQYPVDIEFTVNFTYKGALKINIVQCRPLQTKGQSKPTIIPKDINSSQVLFKSEGNFMGGSLSQKIKRIIYIDPKGYSLLPLVEKYNIARLVGKLNKELAAETIPTMLLGPGRWGTTDPSLGVPVGFAEINNIAILGEISDPASGLMPELSFGTHFFQDLVEEDVFYVALFTEKEQVYFNKEFLDQFPNRLASLLPEKAIYQEVVKVYEVSGANIEVLADVVSQQMICYSSLDHND
ncbi:MAG: PEP/pyruvate-binding domain-containing protein, partial [Bacillota bacterium]|nr:PEP/pyruvate-binding domain-containing protein [Bacillota bacterium]